MERAESYGKLTWDKKHLFLQLTEYEYSLLKKHFNQMFYNHLPIKDILSVFFEMNKTERVDFVKLITKIKDDERVWSKEIKNEL